MAVQCNAHSVPEGWVQVMTDLRGAPPIYFLDTSHGKWDFDYAPLENYETLATFVAANYTLETEISGVRFYRRN